MGDLGRLSDVKALRKIFDPNGLRLIDIGCGDGALARKLAYVGATVLGVTDHRCASLPHITTREKADCDRSSLGATGPSLDEPCFTLRQFTTKRLDYGAVIDLAEP